MPALSVRLRDRNFVPTRGDEAPYKLVPKRYSKSAIGGCKEAEIQVTGGPTAVWEAADFLRYDVMVVDSQGNNLWWGYVNAIDIEVGHYRFGVTLDTMGNFVAIAYGRQLPGAVSNLGRATTPYASDAVSVSTYGIKERLLSLPNATDFAALQRRDQELAANKLPVPTIAWSAGRSAEVKATLRCKGWWHTLDWRYATQPQDVVQHTETNSDEVFTDLRTDANYSKIAQSFLSDPEVWAGGALQFRARRVGSPTVTIRASIQADSAGAPSGTMIDSADIDSSALGSSVAWLQANFAGGGVDLTASTTYWLVFEIVSGTTDNDNHVEVEASKFNVYTDGAGKVWNGSAWVLPHGTDNYDYLFILSGVRETTRMMAAMISSYGPFFTSSYFPTASGIFTNAYLDGDSTTREEMEQMMDIGTGSLVRYLADVDPTRALKVYPEPASTVVKYFLRPDGRIFNQYDVEEPARFCPVAIWAKLDEVIPATANISTLADPSLVFIDEAEYDVEKDLYVPSPRSLGTVWSQLGKIRRV